jgi:RNA polymerase sigma factor (sigma-70 family)
METAHDAFGHLYRRHARRLLTFLAARIPQCDLDDLHQDIWQRVWHHLPGQYRGGNFRAWLRQIARNALVDHARKRRPEQLPDERALPDPNAASPDTPLVEQERMVALARCLEQLDAVASALVRARLGGEGYHEVCLRLKLTPARAHRLFHEAKGRLQDCVERAVG